MILEILDIGNIGITMFKHTRKYHTKLVIDNVSRGMCWLFEPFGFSRKMIGFFVFLFHWTLTASALVALCFEPCHSTAFLLGMGLWVAVFIHHFYFHGCIFTKIERHLWKTDQWKGPWSLLPFPIHDIGYITWGVLLTMFVLIKCKLYGGMFGGR